MFESFVNSIGSKANSRIEEETEEFESFVNSIGSKAACGSEKMANSLRALLIQ